MSRNSLEYQSLLHLIREISRERIPQTGSVEEVRILEISDPPQVYSHWMSVILLTCNDLKITFKTHFKTRTAQLLAAPLFSLPPERVTKGQALDCMREYGNLTERHQAHTLEISRTRFKPSNLDPRF